MKKYLWIIILGFYAVVHLLNALGLIGHSLLYAMAWLLFGLIDIAVILFALKSQKDGKKLGKVISIALSVWLLLQSSLSLAVMLKGTSKDTKNADVVFVLGYQLDNDQMSSTLISRLEKAYDYAVDNPHCKIIVSGGITRNNTVSEASLMKKALVSFGIDENRIVSEENSKDTIENIRYCKNLMDNGDKVVIISSQYHCSRVQEIAKKQDLQVSTLGAHAPINLLMNQLMIEKIATVLVWLG